MRRALPTVLAALAVLVALAATSAPSAHAQGAPFLRIGIADQKPGMFTDPLFEQLDLRIARIVVPWDVLSQDWQRAELADWMAAAHAAGVRPLVAFGRSRRPGRARSLPSPERLRRQFSLLHRQYPWVTDWATWNEANHCSQPTCRRPELVARYFDKLVDTCPRCRIIGAEVLDQPNMVAWVEGFQRAARHRPRIWGLHNYIDANRMRTIGTRRLLAHTRGEIWFTETGGIVKRLKKRKIGGFPETPSHAAAATRWLFDRLAPLSPRITRVYLYHWNQATRRDNWDSALVTLAGRPRPAFRVLAREVRRQAVRAARARRG